MGGGVKDEDRHAGRWKKWDISNNQKENKMRRPEEKIFRMNCSAVSQKTAQGPLVMGSQKYNDALEFFISQPFPSSAQTTPARVGIRCCKQYRRGGNGETKDEGGHLKERKENDE